MYCLLQSNFHWNSINFTVIKLFRRIFCYYRHSLVMWLLRCSANFILTCSEVFHPLNRDCLHETLVMEQTCHEIMGKTESENRIAREKIVENPSTLENCLSDVRERFLLAAILEHCFLEINSRRMSLSLKISCLKDFFVMVALWDFEPLS